MIARIIGTPLGERLGHNIIIDHRPGANGNISAEVVAAAKPDGYTLLYANNSTVVINPHIYTKWKLKPLEDLVPVVTTITNQLVLAANPTVVPANDLRGFVEFMKGKSLFYASIGNGSQHHLAMEMLKQRSGHGPDARAVQGRRSGFDRGHRRRERRDVRRHLGGAAHHIRQAQAASR